MPDYVRTKSGGIISGKEQILDTWKTYFRDLLNLSENPSDIPPLSLRTFPPVFSGLSVDSSELSDPFTPEELEMALHKVNSKSSPGFCNSYELLCDCQ